MTAYKLLFNSIQIKDLSHFTVTWFLISSLFSFIGIGAKIILGRVTLSANALKQESLWFVLSMPRKVVLVVRGKLKGL